MFDSYIEAVADPENSERGGGKKHEIYISHRTRRPSFYDYFFKGVRFFFLGKPTRHYVHIFLLYIFPVDVAQGEKLL